MNNMRCSEQFLAYLKAHTKVTRTYGCDICRVSFADYGALVRHAQGAHGRKDQSNSAPALSVR